MKYYSKLRPISPGTYPTDGMPKVLEIHNYDEKQYVKDAGGDVWGYVKYDGELIPEIARRYELTKGGKAEDVDTMNAISALEQRLHYAMIRGDGRPELDYVHNYLRAALEEFHKATGCTISDEEAMIPTFTLAFEVKRIRRSVTQGAAEIWCNGERFASFGDDMKIIEPGEKYYGEIITGWASMTPDAQFIKAALFHQHENRYHMAEGVWKIIDREIKAESDRAMKGEATHD